MSIALGLAAALLAAPPQGVSGPEHSQVVQVDVTACPRLDAERVRSLVLLELAQSFANEPPSRTYEVFVECDDELLRIEVDDAATAKQISRTPPPLVPTDPDPERTAALGASQLFIASWGELSTPPPAEHPPLPVSAQQEHEKIEAVERRAVAPPSPPFRHVVGLGAAVRARNLGSPNLVAAIGLHYRPAWRVPGRPRLELGPYLGADFELGARRRGFGRVDLWSAGGGGGLWLGGAVGRRVTLVGRAGAAARWQRLAGVPRAGSSFVGATVDGLGVDLSGGCALALPLSRARLSVGVEGGYLAGGPTGTTPEQAVTLRGVWIGALIAIDFGFRPSGPRQHDEAR